MKLLIIYDDRPKRLALSVWQWWDGELERAYALHRARQMHEDSTRGQQAPGGPVPAYLRQRVERKRRLPRVQLQEDNGGRATRASAESKGDQTDGQASQEGMDAVLKYAIQDLVPELYVELMMGFHK
jgi:hypothetical protein